MSVRRIVSSRKHSSADENSMAASGMHAMLVLFALGLGRALLIGVTAAGATAIELDAVAGTGDTVALASARAGGAGHGRGGGAGRARAAAGERRAVGVDIRLVVVGFLLRLLEGGIAQAIGELLESCLSELGVDNLLRLTWALRARRHDLAGLDSTATWDVAGVAARGTLAGRAAGRLAGWHVEDVELATGGRLDGVLAGWVVGNVIAVHHVVVPVSLTGSENCVLEAKGSSPGSGLGAIARKRELALIAVPGSDKMNCLDIGRCAESKAELNCGHYCSSWIRFATWFFSKSRLVEQEAVN
jgi:hypothetical protein